MFLTEDIPGGLSPRETIARIKAQGGLACLPHPLDRFRGIARNYEEIEKVIADVDIIEAFNSRVFFKSYNNKAAIFAREHSLPCSAGSDAHIPHEIGHAYVEMPDFDGIQEFCSSLKQGKIFGRRSCPLVHVPTSWMEFKRKFVVKH